MGKRGFRGISGQRRPVSACAYAQADLGLRGPLTVSLDTVDFRCIAESMIRPEYFAGWSDDDDDDDDDDEDDDDGDDMVF